MMCDFCKSENLEFVYEVLDSMLGVKIATCDNCGLVQSIITKTKKDKERRISTSSGATWGNIRHGKGLRLKVAMKILESFIPWDEIKNVLDVGSNRGDFVQWLRKTTLPTNITAVEPDKSIIDDYKSLPDLTLYVDRFENINLPFSRFDLAYCSHTLEHAHSASAMLKQIHKTMKTKGYLFIEVPNIDILTAKNTVEEFFMDKHRFHFNRSLLCDYLNYLGFRIIFANESTDIYNITLLLRKEFEAKGEVAFAKKDDDLSRYNKEIIKKYAYRLKSNRNNLKKVVGKLHPFMERQKVAFWGGGRIFDALVCYGGLNVDKVYCLVDKYLWKYVPAVHGVEIKRPEYLKVKQPDVVIILARSSAEEIYREVQRFGFRRTIIKFSALFTNEP